MTGSVSADELPAHPLAAGAFALVCATELEPLARTCPDAAVVGSLGHALGLVRERLTGAATDPAELVRARAKLSALTGADAKLGPFHSQVDDALGAAGYAVDALLDGGPEPAAAAAGRVREVYVALAGERWATLSYPELLRLPLVTSVVDRQRQVAERLGRADPAQLGSVLPDLLTQAAEAGRQLADLITGGPAERGAPATDEDQESLF